MKQIKLLSSFALAGMLLFACNNGDQKTAATDSTSIKDSSAVKTETAVKPVYTMLILHKVKNFAKWRAAYDAGDSARVANGLHNFVIGRGAEDSSMVLVALTVDDTTKAKQFGESADLKATMQKAGVVGTPQVRLNEMFRLVTDTASNRVVVMHKVKDFDTWKKVFDSHKQTRTDAGLTDRSYGYSTSDHNMVSVVFTVNDMAKAKAFMDSKDLKDKMTEAGVIGKPDVFAYHVVQQY